MRRPSLNLLWPSPSLNLLWPSRRSCGRTWCRTQRRTSGYSAQVRRAHRPPLPFSQAPASLARFAGIGGRILPYIARASTLSLTCGGVCVCMAGERGIGRHGTPMQYAHTRFHRAMPDAFVQGGDILTGDGSGGESIYASPQTPTFRDENFKLRHDQAGAWQPLMHPWEPMFVGRRTRRRRLASSPCRDGRDVTRGPLRRPL